MGPQTQWNTTVLKDLKWMSLNTTCSQKQHWRHFVILLFWGQCYVVSDSMCYCVWSHFVVFGATVLCCDLKRDWEHILWLRTLCGVFFDAAITAQTMPIQLNHSTNNAPSNSITSEMHHPNKLQLFYIRHGSINNKWSVYNSLPPPVSSLI